MAAEDSGNELAKKQPGETRRRFLAKLGIGAAALALVGSPLGILSRGRGRRDVANQQFPGEDSIFHPASDPRSDPRRRS